MDKITNSFRQLIRSCLFIGLIGGLFCLGQAMPAEATPSWWTYDDFLNGKTPQTYTVRQGHPRLLITPDNRQEIIDKINAAPGLWNEVIYTAENRTGSEKVVLCCAALYQIGLIPGFNYAMTQQEYGQRGVAELMAITDVKKFRLGLPLGYDWLYDVLTLSQRVAIIDLMFQLVPNFDTMNSPRGNGVILGLAFYGDGIRDAEALNIVETKWNDVWWNNTDYNYEPVDDNRWKISIPANLLYLQGGGWTEGVSYYHFNSVYFPVIAAWKTATGQDFFANMGYFRTVPYWMSHCVVPRPQSITNYHYSFPLYDYSSERMLSKDYTAMVAASTGYLKDVDPQGASLARWWVDRERGYDNIDMPMGLVFGLLIGDPRVVGELPSQSGIPKTFEMQGLNNVYMRSSWDDPDATVVGFANTHFFSRASGENVFALWKNGGALFPYRGAVIDHDYWYSYSKGYPKNGVVFYEGATLIQPLHTTSRLPAASSIGSSYDIGTLSTISEPDEYDYMRGASPKGYYYIYSYNNYSPANIKQAERILVYLRPVDASETDWVILLDRLETDFSSKQPHVVFNTVFEPKLGKTWNSEDTGTVVLPGQWRIEDAPCVVVTNEYPYQLQYGLPNGGPVINAHARAFLKTLYPKEIQTVKIGGVDYFLDGLAGEPPGNEWTKEFRDADENQRVLRGGYWRFHVVPTAQDTRHTVLTAIEATDSAIQQPNNMDLLESNDILGAQVGPNIVLFSKDGGKVSTASVNVLTAATVRILICDLNVDTRYDLIIGSNQLSLTSSSEGTIFVKDMAVASDDTISIKATTSNSGDINDDGIVGILDLQLCVNVFLGTETTPEYVQRAKEVAEPLDECNVLDVQVIVNTILGP